MMEDYRKKWEECLRQIRGKYGEKFQHWFDVWYGDVRFESYDAETHTLLVQVPSKYVYEYLEMNGAKDIRWATQEVFGTKVVLQYRIIAEPTFAEVADYLSRNGYDSRRDPFHVSIPNARRRMEDGLQYFLGDGGYQWVSGYDRVAEWLSDNKGKGLLCIGTTGLGKTLLCTKVLPVILGNGGRPIPCVPAVDIKSRLDELKKERIVIIDDLGKEPRKFYGNIDNSFFELCNNAERTGSLLVITSSLSTTPVSDPRYPDSIEHRYGQDVISRLRAITSVALFEGQDMRR